MKEEGHGLYECLLQVEMTTEIRYLTNTLSIMNTPFLTKAVQDAISGECNDLIVVENGRNIAKKPNKNGPTGTSTAR